MEPLILLVRKGSIMIGGGDVSLPVWGPEFFGGGLFPGGSFGNVRVMSLSLAEREEEVSELRGVEEREDVRESDVVGGGPEKGGEPWLP